MKTWLCLIALQAAAILGLRAESDAPGQPQADQLFHQLLDAQSRKDYDAFVFHGTVELKAALTKTQFDASSDLMIVRLRSGCDIDALGELNRKGYQIYLYRLRFKDSGDDILGTMTLKAGQVAGIFFK